MKLTRQLLCALLGMTAFAAAGQDRTDYKFDFATWTRPGREQVKPDMVYDAARGYGFEPGAEVKITDKGFATSDKPFLFSVKVPEGNYNVVVTLGDPSGASDTVVKAELRRLMVEDGRSKGEFINRAFTVNVRTPKIPGGGEVKLKDREKTSETMAWDDKLTLEFNGTHPALRSLEISPAQNAVTVFLLGDSTVCDQPDEPWASWGQMLPRFFGPGVAIANHAESGESMKSSLGAHRFDKVFKSMKPGDYLFIQYGHNDQKEKGTNLAFTSYKTDLANAIIETRKHECVPVLVTSMERKAGVESNTLGDYPEAVRQAARENSAMMIDLNAMSREFYKALGPDLGKAFQDGTHHNNYGAYEFARCVVEGIRIDRLGLRRFVRDDVKPFNPSHPDAVADFHLPASPKTGSVKPMGD